jgi:protein dithiol:quinone oxidoreductase
LSPDLEPPPRAPFQTSIEVLGEVILTELWSRLTLRSWLALACAVCVGLLAFGLYLQHYQGLEPCPMCVVQRYTLVLIALCAGLGAALGGRFGLAVGGWLTVLFGAFGAFVAARQSWLQWYPPEMPACGRDIYGMIETFPLQRLVPMIFKGSGDCSKIDWTFLGGSIANWSFVAQAGIAVVTIALLLRRS